MAYVSSDRKGSGLILGLDVTTNITIASLNSVSPFGFIQADKEAEIARRQVESLGIRAASLNQEVQSLSGGNQQKVLLAKWAETSPRVFLLDEPTRGVDVGAKHEIYSLINRWTEEGIGVVLITSELQELIGLADRILVMHRGSISAELSRGQITRERVMRAAMGEAWMN
jgi:ABC-type sugar transport system ATPase subunit